MEFDVQDRYADPAHRLSDWEMDEECPDNVHLKGIEFVEEFEGAAKEYGEGYRACVAKFWGHPHRFFVKRGDILRTAGIWER